MSVKCDWYLYAVDLMRHLKVLQLNLRHTIEYLYATTVYIYIYISIYIKKYNLIVNAYSKRYIAKI